VGIATLPSWIVRITAAVRETGTDVLNFSLGLRLGSTVADKIDLPEREEPVAGGAIAASAFEIPAGLLTGAGAVPAPPVEEVPVGLGKSSYRPDIDGLRALAVLPVVFYHAGLGLTGGFVGVDVFFVISGFLITSLIQQDLHRGRFTLAGFYERRIRRIFPALFAVIAACFVAAWLLFLPPEFKLFAKSAITTALFSSNILFFLQSGYFDSEALLKPLLHTWSLAVEEQFYILFPLILMALHSVSRGRLLLTLSLLCAASFAASSYSASAYPEAGFYLMPMRFWELAVGALLALAGTQLRLAEKMSALAAAAGVAMILVAVFHFDVTTPFPGFAALLPCAGALLILLAGWSSNPASRVLAAGPFVFIGKISYSLYLWHWPVLVFAQYRLGRLLGPAESAVAVTASLILAFLSWRYVEQPFRQKRLLAERRQLFAGAVAAIAVTVAAGLVVVARDGMPSRLPGEVQRIYQSAERNAHFTSDECFADAKGNGATAADIRAGRLCIIGPPKGPAPSFLLWGDSHAGAVLPALETPAKEHGLRGYFVGRSSCLPLIDYQISSAHKGNQRRCREANLATLDLIRSARIKTVFLVGRWPREVLGAEYGNEGTFFDPNRPYQIHNRSALVRHGLDRTLAALAAMGTRAIVVQDVPEIGYDVPHGLALAGMRGVEANIAPSLRTVMGREHTARELVRETAARHGAVVIDPLPSLCGPERCMVQDGDVPLYSDSDHLSTAGAARLVPLFRPWLLPADPSGVSSWNLEAELRPIERAAH
jgi:peptidoglycan/LPS O-acetylase OafA/YrhL